MLCYINSYLVISETSQLGISHRTEPRGPDAHYNKRFLSKVRGHPEKASRKPGSHESNLAQKGSGCACMTEGGEDRETQVDMKVTGSGEVRAWSQCTQGEM